MNLGQEIQTLCRKIVLPKNFAEFGGTTPPPHLRRVRKKSHSKGGNNFANFGGTPPPSFTEKNLPVAFSGGL